MILTDIRISRNVLSMKFDFSDLLKKFQEIIKPWK